MFARSQVYASPAKVEVEEMVEGEKILYDVPAELSDFMFRYDSTRTLMVFNHRTRSAEPLLFL